MRRQTAKSGKSPDASIGKKTLARHDAPSATSPTVGKSKGGKQRKGKR